ncbi:MAG TPA: hypothetical protein PK078_11315 [Anaerolineales bacterium]|nr:hypothetical protein [Anaerolineales bacterium]
MQNEPEFKSEDQHHEFTVKRWLQWGGIAVINVLILAFFSSYFKDEPLSLLGIISVLADSTGIVLGLLGIWFFFLSEKLNKDTAVNLEKTTSAVEELRDQMWDMIQKTFNTFVEKENKEKVEETKDAIEQLKQQVQSENKPISSDVLAALDKISDRINTLEQKEQLFVKPLSRIATVSEISPKQIRQLIVDLFDQFPMSANDLSDKVKEKFAVSGSALEFIQALVNRGYFVTLDDKNPTGKELTGITIMDVAPAFVDVLPKSLQENYKTRKSA